jgi:hypothetical protein
VYFGIVLQVGDWLSVVRQKCNNAKKLKKLSVFSFKQLAPIGIGRFGCPLNALDPSKYFTLCVFQQMALKSPHLSAWHKACVHFTKE